MKGLKMPREVIVVDGCSTDRTVNIIKENFPDIIVLNNLRRTAAAGRNIGIKEAIGDIIAFTDGDCIVDNNWIKDIRRYILKEQDIDGLGGRVLNAQPSRTIMKNTGEI